MLLLLWIINALALLIAADLVPGFAIGGFYSALIAALVLGLVNMLIRPIVLLLTLPINLLTLGLFTLVVNGFMIWIVASVVKGVTVETFGSAISVAIVLWLISFVSNWFAAQLHRR